MFIICIISAGGTVQTDLKFVELYEINFQFGWQRIEKVLSVHFTATGILTGFTWAHPICNNTSSWQAIEIHTIHS